MCPEAGRLKGTPSQGGRCRSRGALRAALSAGHLCLVIALCDLKRLPPARAPSPLEEGSVPCCAPDSWRSTRPSGPLSAAVHRQSLAAAGLALRAPRSQGCSPGSAAGLPRVGPLWGRPIDGVDCTSEGQRWGWEAPGSERTSPSCGQACSGCSVPTAATGLFSQPPGPLAGSTQPWCRGRWHLWWPCPEGTVVPMVGEDRTGWQWPQEGQADPQWGSAPPSSGGLVGLQEGPGPAFFSPVPGLALGSKGSASNASLLAVSWLHVLVPCGRSTALACAPPTWCRPGEQRGFGGLSVLSPSGLWRRSPVGRGLASVSAPQPWAGPRRPFSLPGCGCALHQRAGSALCGPHSFQPTCGTCSFLSPIIQSVGHTLPALGQWWCPPRQTLG